MKVVVVDDSEMLRRRIISMISDVPGIEIAGEAENSHEAMKIIDKVVPEIVVLDIRMPNGNGIELLKSISQRNLTMVKIVLSNYSMQQFKDKCYELGADYFFDKANEFEKVRKLIMKIMSERKAISHG